MAAKIAESGQAVVRVSYGLYGPTLDPTKVTRETSISPTRAYSKADRIPTGRSRGNASWTLDALGSGRETFEAQVAQLLGALRPAWATFATLGKRHHAYIQAVAESREKVAISLTPNDAHDLWELGAELIVTFESDI